MIKILNVRVISNAKKDEVIQEADGLRVRVTAPPLEGRANKALIEVLAEFYRVKKGAVKILKGEKSKNKIVGVDIKAVSPKV